MKDGRDRDALLVRLTGAKPGDEKERAAAALYRYNAAQTGVADRAPIGAELTDSSGKVLGGLWGRTELGVLFLDMFFLPPHLRGQSHGQRLLGAVEDEARKGSCKRAVVETSSFQAPGFYRHHGYEEFGRVKFCLPGHPVFSCARNLDETRPRPWPELLPLLEWNEPPVVVDLQVAGMGRLGEFAGFHIDEG